jgi:hypothetical protein
VSLLAVKVRQRRHVAHLHRSSQHRTHSEHTANTQRTHTAHTQRTHSAHTVHTQCTDHSEQRPRMCCGKCGHCVTLEAVARVQALCEP